MTDTLDQLRSDIDIAQKAFRARCRAILREAYQDADSIATAIGTISVDEAFHGWVEQVRERLNRPDPQDRG